MNCEPFYDGNVRPHDLPHCSLNLHHTLRVLPSQLSCRQCIALQFVVKSMENCSHSADELIRDGIHISYELEHSNLNQSIFGMLGMPAIE